MRSASRRRRSLSTGRAPSGASTAAWSCRMVKAPGRRMPSATARAAAAAGSMAKPPPDSTSTSAAASSGRPSAPASPTQAWQTFQGRSQAGQRRCRPSPSMADQGCEDQLAQAVERAWPGRPPRTTSAGSPRRPRRRRGASRGSRPAVARTAWRSSPSAPARVREPAAAPTSMPSTRLPSSTASDATRPAQGGAALLTGHVPATRGGGRPVRRPGKSGDDGPWRTGSGAGKREEPVIGDALRTLDEGTAGDDGEVVAQARQRPGTRPEEACAITLLRVGLTRAPATTTASRPGSQAGTAEGERSGSGPKKRAPTCQPRAVKARSRRPPVSDVSRHQAGARRPRRCAPPGATRCASPPWSPATLASVRATRQARSSSRASGSASTGRQPAASMR